MLIFQSSLILIIKKHIFLILICLVPDDRRRVQGVRREDPRRHTLGGDMLGYGHQGQGLPIQRSMDLEVCLRFFLVYSY